jgi:predicted kinase
VATLHLVCGLPGSGKSTLARQLAEADATIWLSPDEWMSRIVGDGYDERRRAAVERIQWELAKKLLALGIDIVLDNGFWSREERMSLRREADGLGARTELHFLDVPLAELTRRIAARNAASPLWVVGEADLEKWSALFEPPEADELPVS